LTTNASRLKILAGKSKCVEFGMRRAQGPNGAMIASKYSYLGGFDGTSNVYSGYLAGVPV
jgi:nicotinate phosphoribosyltransferase